MNFNISNDLVKSFSQIRQKHFKRIQDKKSEIEKDKAIINNNEFYRHFGQDGFLSRINERILNESAIRTKIKHHNNKTDSRINQTFDGTLNEKNEDDLIGVKSEKKQYFDKPILNEHMKTEEKKPNYYDESPTKTLGIDGLTYFGSRKNPDIKIKPDKDPSLTLKEYIYKLEYQKKLDYQNYEKVIIKKDKKIKELEQRVSDLQKVNNTYMRRAGDYSLFS